MRWIWIDRILELEKGARCVALKNVSAAEEQVHDHFPGSPVMPATLMIEGMAQTAGILTGHARDFKEKVILAKIAKAAFECEVFPGQSIIYEATLERIDEAGAMTSGVVKRITLDSVKGETEETVEQIGVVDLMFSHIDNNMSGLNFPEENFVFTDQFFNLLERSGFPVNIPT